MPSTTDLQQSQNEVKVHLLKAMESDKAETLAIPIHAEFNPSIAQNPSHEELMKIHPGYQTILMSNPVFLRDVMNLFRIRVAEFSQHNKNNDIYSRLDKIKHVFMDEIGFDIGPDKNKMSEYDRIVSQMYPNPNDKGRYARFLDRGSKALVQKVFEEGGLESIKM